MLWRLCIPLIALILLRDLALLGEIAAGVVQAFEQDYQTLVCARETVYRLNLDDGWHYLAARYPYVAEQGLEEGMDDDQDCDKEGFRVFRETNPKLPPLYPNWLYRERARGD